MVILMVRVTHAACRAEWPGADTPPRILAALLPAVALVTRQVYYLIPLSDLAAVLRARNAASIYPPLAAGERRRAL